MESVMQDYNCIKLKAPSKNKSDITIQIHDITTQYQPILGFSILPIYNRNLFDNYLFSNIYLETSSTLKHDFGTVKLENNDLIIKLNLQIRFLNRNKV